MKKVLVLAVLGLLVLAGVAQAAGLFDNRPAAQTAIPKRERLLMHKAQQQGQASTSRARRGRRGRRGFPGTRGPAGPPGTFGTLTTVKGPSTFLCGWEGGGCSVGASVAACPSGTSVVSGGFAGAGIRAFVSAPVPGGWYVAATNESAYSTTFNAVAICAS